MPALRTFVGISVFWLGLSVLGDAFTGIVLAQRVAALGDPSSLATILGLTATVGILAAMLVQPIAGAVSDLARHRIGRGGQVLAGAVLALPALALFAVARDVPTLAAAFVLVAVAASVAQAAQQGYLPDQVPAAWRGRAAGVKGLADLGGAFVGFLVLGALLAGGDATPAVVATAGFLLVTAILAVALVRERRSGGHPDRACKRAPVQRAIAKATSGLDAAARTAFAKVVLARFLFLLGTFVLGRFLLLFVAERLRIPAESAADEAAGLLAGLTLVGALTAIPAGWVADRAGRIPTMAAGGALGALGAALFLSAGDLGQMLLFGSLISLGSAGFASANWAMTADLVPAGGGGAFFGLANVGTAGAAAAAGLFGPLVDVVRPAFPGLGYGGFVAIAMVLMALGAVAALSLRGSSSAAVPLVLEAKEP